MSAIGPQSGILPHYRQQRQDRLVDQGYTGETAAAATERITLHVVKLPEGKRRFVLLPRRWVVERSFAWAMRCRRLVNYERSAETLAGFDVIAFVGYMLKHTAGLKKGA